MRCDTIFTIYVNIFTSWEIFICSIAIYEKLTGNMCDTAMYSFM